MGGRLGRQKPESQPKQAQAAPAKGSGGKEKAAAGNALNATAAQGGAGGAAAGPAGGGAASVDDFSGLASDSKLTMEDFSILKVLGKGAFGKVMLVKKKDDKKNTLYALKTLRKAEIVKRGQIDHTKTERVVLERIHCPFLIHLIYAFQTTEKLYMVLEYSGGGELFFWIRKQHRFSEARSRLYAAEVLLAVAAMHKENIIHRDLKPENILCVPPSFLFSLNFPTQKLTNPSPSPDRTHTARPPFSLDAEGHVKLTDFGLAKGGITGAGAEGGTRTFCGTPEYVAPEIIEQKGHGKAVDWWALGAILYEMLYGLPPFYDTNVNKMYQKIAHDPLRFREDPGVSEAAKDMLRKMLDRRVSTRLGSGPGGAEEIKSSPFFAQNIDFGKVLAKQYVPEFRPPAMRSETDVRNFDAEFTREIPADSLVTHAMSDTMQVRSNFEGFTYQQDNVGGP